MKSSNEIRNRAKKIVEGELDRRLRFACKRLPVLCVHNHRQPLDFRKTVEGDPNLSYNTHSGPTLGLCMLGASDGEWPGNICEDPSDAQTCPSFLATSTKAQILSQFREDLSNPSWIEAHMPSLHELLWVLDNVTPLNPGLLFRILFYFRVVSPEPLSPKLLPELLLDEVSDS